MMLLKIKIMDGENAVVCAISMNKHEHFLRENNCV